MPPLSLVWEVGIKFVAVVLYGCWPRLQTVSEGIERFCEPVESKVREPFLVELGKK